MRCLGGAALLALAALNGVRVQGVILYGAGDPAYNTQAPEGALAGSGWQHQGIWSDFLGTAIAPNLFVTAKHVGGAPGQSFLYRGSNYVATAFHDHPSVDLRIWEVCGTFPGFAPLYEKSDEVNKSFVFIGRGTQRGEEIRVNGALKGWKWGIQDGALRWGMNRVSDAPVRADGSLLRAVFDASGGANEAHLSTGDSSGPAFIQDGGVWKLAGIGLSVDGPFNDSLEGPGFFGAVFDAGGLYVQVNNQWTPIPDTIFPVPSGFFLLRISAYAEWMRGIIAEHGAEGGAQLLMASSPEGPYTRSEPASVDAAARTFTLPVGSSTQFFRLRSCAGARLKFIHISGGKAVIGFE